MTLTKDIIRLNDEKHQKKRKRNRTQKEKLIKLRNFQKTLKNSFYYTPLTNKNPFPKGRGFFMQKFFISKGIHSTAGQLRDLLQGCRYYLQWLLPPRYKGAGVPDRASAPPPDRGQGVCRCRSGAGLHRVSAR
ncbi:MAG: hypothetical protein V8Q32_02785 [Anaerotignum faecicola]